jgi:hypothetical protein
MAKADSHKCANNVSRLLERALRTILATSALLIFAGMWQPSRESVKLHYQIAANSNAAAVVDRDINVTAVVVPQRARPMPTIRPQIAGPRKPRCRALLLIPRIQPHFPDSSIMLVEMRVDSERISIRSMTLRRNLEDKSGDADVAMPSGGSRRQRSHLCGWRYQHRRQIRLR